MAAASERVFEFLDEEEEDITVENPVKPDHIEGSVEFSHVHFGYNPDQIIINDFSAKVKPGQQVAIVGPTGAGKTTMVKLLMRFYDVSSGAILVDGHDIRDYNRADLRDAFGWYLQDTWLFKGTIMENIRYGLWMPQMRRSSRQQRQHMRITLSRHCRVATIWSSTRMHPMCHRDKSSF